jgi:zinc transport system substrate-binding protein
MKELAQAGAWVLSGAEFEVGLLPKIRDVFSGLAIINGTDGVSFRMLDPEHSAARIMARGDELSDDEDHGEHGIDRHTWLGSGPAKILGASIRDALALIDPAGEDAYNENYMALVREIDDEFAGLRSELLPLKGGVVYVYHPSFGYFLDEFGIRQEAVETGGKEPGPRELGRLISEMKRERAPAIFVQAQFPVNAARAVAQATGAQLVSLDPLSADWLANIRVMGNALKAAAYGGNF